MIRNYFWHLQMRFWERRQKRRHRSSTSAYMRSQRDHLIQTITKLYEEIDKLEQSQRISEKIISELKTDLQVAVYRAAHPPLDVNRPGYRRPRARTALK